jgi:catecholate siderophore receptor
MRHELLVGLEVGSDKNNVNNSSRNLPGSSFFTFVNLEDPAYFGGSNLPSTQGNVVDAKATTVAPYVNDTISLSKQWKLIVGARYDRYSASLTNSLNAPSTASQTAKFTSVRGGLIYQPSDVQSYYVSYVTSYNPSLEALTLSNGAQSLDPEKSRAYELGGKWDLLDGNLAASAAVFQTDKTNARTQVSPGVFELAGNVRVRGFEAGATGRLSRTWQVLAGYTYLNARLVDTAPGDTSNPEGNTLANTPTHSGALWVAYTPTREWEYGTGITAMTERYNSNANVVSVPYYLRWDATIAYHLPKYDFRFNILNLTNRLNYEQLIPSDRGRSVPSTDRMALLTFTARF